MKTRLSIDADVFLDASYVIALANAKDNAHESALQISNILEARNTRLVTTYAILLEIGNGLCKPRFRATASAILLELSVDPNVTIVPWSKQHCNLAIDLFRSRTDKEWGLTDCHSFVVMNELDLKQALTADQHFTQAGFVALLR